MSLGSPIGLVTDGTYLYVLNSTSLLQYNTSGTLIKTVASLSDYRTIAYNSNDGKIYALYNDGTSI
jgi:hypothetical protein